MSTRLSRFSPPSSPVKRRRDTAYPSDEVERTTFHEDLEARRPTSTRASSRLPQSLVKRPPTTQTNPRVSRHRHRRASSRPIYHRSRLTARTPTRRASTRAVAPASPRGVVRTHSRDRRRVSTTFSATFLVRQRDVRDATQTIRSPETNRWPSTRRASRARSADARRGARCGRSRRVERLPIYKY